MMVKLALWRKAEFPTALVSASLNRRAFVHGLQNRGFVCEAPFSAWPSSEESASLLCSSLPGTCVWRSLMPGKLWGDGAAMAQALKILHCGGKCRVLEAAPF